MPTTYAIDNWTPATEPPCNVDLVLASRREGNRLVVTMASWWGGRWHDINGDELEGVYAWAPAPVFLPAPNKEIA